MYSEADHLPSSPGRYRHDASERWGRGAAPGTEDVFLIGPGAGAGNVIRKPALHGCFGVCPAIAGEKTESFGMDGARPVPGLDLSDDAFGVWEGPAPPTTSGRSPTSMRAPGSRPGAGGARVAQRKIGNMPGSSEARFSRPSLHDMSGRGRQLHDPSELPVLSSPHLAGVRPASSRNHRSCNVCVTSCDVPEICPDAENTEEYSVVYDRPPARPGYPRGPRP